MTKDLFIDVETTGLFDYKHGVTQISLILDIDGQTVERHNWQVKPFRSDEIDMRALEIQGRSLEEIQLSPEPRDVFDQLCDVLAKYVNKYSKTDKFNFLAYNSTFDNGFMRKFFNKNGDKYFGSWFWNPDICVMRLAMHHLRDQRHLLPDFKLGTVAKALDIHSTSGGGLHDAQTDIDLTHQMYQLIERHTLRA